MNLAMTAILCLAAAGLFVGCARQDPPARKNDNDRNDELVMEQYRRSHRPLLLFAPAGNDPHLRAMLGELAEQVDSFQERDMVLLEIVPGQSRAGGEPLSEDQAAALRRHYRIDNDEFAVVLVGKDGTVKLNSRRVVPAESIFDLIDQMPMRRREMQEDR
ncbi:MAG: DUF4174 domain-containing protein [Phycisphaerae bacterium]